MKPLSILDRIIDKSPAQVYFKRRVQSMVAVLAYHDIGNATCFADQMDHVCTYCHPVSVEAVCGTIRSGSPLPERAVLVTFDDGHRSVLETALQILGERGVPAVAYVVAGLLDTDQPYWWDEVEALVTRGGQTEYVAEGTPPGNAVRTLKKLSNEQRLAALAQLRDTASSPAPRMPQLRRDELHELEAGGITIGNHTLTHPCLHQCDEATIRHELAASQQILTDVLGHAPRTLAYPNGDHDPRVRQAVEDMGFDAAFLFDHRLSASPPADPLRISRLRVNDHTPMDRFKIILSGLHPAIHHALGRS